MDCSSGSFNKYNQSLLMCYDYEKEGETRKGEGRGRGVRVGGEGGN